jgi:hypothetical protein
MKFNPEINRYLSGELFSAGLNIPFNTEKYPSQSRIEKIIELVKDKRVIHVGCADHLPLIEEKIKKNNWLHKLLLENTKCCIGIDNNAAAVNYINTKLNIKDAYCLDILTENLPSQNDMHWDYMILGEIIEHIDNPIAFLYEIREKYKGRIDKIIVTAPNIFNLLIIKDIKNNIENINTDHRYWFSPYTITKVLYQSGFTNCELTFAERVKLPFSQALSRRLKLSFGITPLFNANCFSNLVITAGF